jgi:hypothetical protein
MNISKTDFSIRPYSHGVYSVVYSSPKTGRTWRNTITTMQLIDDTYKVDYPTKAALNRLKTAVKTGKGNQL